MEIIHSTAILLESAEGYVDQGYKGEPSSEIADFLVFYGGSATTIYA